MWYVVNESGYALMRTIQGIREVFEWINPANAAVYYCRQSAQLDAALYGGRVVSRADLFC